MSDAMSEELQEDRYREQQMCEEAEAEELFWRESMLNYDHDRSDWKY